MTILSFSFVFLCLGLLIIYYIIPKSYRWIILLLGSIIFYYLSSKNLIIFIFFSILIIYLIGLSLTKYNEKISALKNSNKSDDEVKNIKVILKTKKRKVVLIGLVLNILCLIITKYSGFIIENVNALFKTNLSFKILLPLGISYYTLEAISYIVDIYRGKYKGEKNPFKVALYLLYFPKIIEGPISKFNELGKEFLNKKLDFNNIIVGMDLIIFGLFKKMVIADRAGIFVNQVFSGAMGGITSIVAMILYTVQIYAEFSGCIDIVRGISLLFGVRLPVNFKRPFFSKCIQEFWTRWHISLGAWIREYVFFPVSLSKMNTKVNKLAKEKCSTYWYKFIIVAFPLLFVWLVNGIWHGASYKYVLYGMYYYIVMMIGLMLKPLMDKLAKKVKVNDKILFFGQIIRTCFLVVIGMTLFRATSLSEFGVFIASIFKNGNGLLNQGLIRIDFIILIVSNLFILLVSILEENKKINLEKGFTKSPLIRAVFYTILICAIIIFGIYGEGYDATSFIYGAF